MNTYRPHAIPPSMLDRFCDADDDLADLDLLLRARRSKSLLALRIVRDLAASGHVGEPHRSAVLRRIDSLAALHRHHRRAATAVLTGPHFGAWATECVRRLTAQGTVDDRVSAVDLDHLGGFVAAIAIRADADIAMSVPVRDSTIVIPAVGRVEMPGMPSAGSAHLRHDRAGLRVAAAGTTVVIPRGQLDRRTLRWRPLGAVHAVLASGRRWEVTVDPDDPYLRFFDPDEADDHDDAGDADYSGWIGRFGTAATVIDGLYDRKAAAMARSISCLVPIAAGAGLGLSATSGSAAGAVALTEPSSGLAMAATLVHEHQHLKLNALHDVLPLVVDSGVRYYSPWRNEPRPASGLLHGAYAFLGVGDFWLRMCRRPLVQRAWQLELARIRCQVVLACDGLTACPDLTDAGVTLVERLASAAAGWHVGDLPPDLARAAGDVAVEHEVRWRLRNVAPSANGEREGQPPAFGTDSPFAVEAKRWAAGERPAGLVDRLVLEGRYERAQSVLIERLRSGPDPVDWTALSVVARHTDLVLECPPLRTHPERVFAEYRAMARGGLAVSFADLARRLG